jgi:hypothetical protein
MCIKEKWFNYEYPYLNAVSAQKSMRRSQRSKGKEAIPLDSVMIRPAKHTNNLFTGILTQRQGGRFSDRKSTEH